MRQPCPADVDDVAMTTAAPDGGWGWVVCFGCFLTHMLADGIFFSFGIIYIDLLDYFGETKSDTAWIVSLPPGVCFIIGPVVAFLVNKYGCRAVVITGSMITCTSFVLSTFAQTIDVMYGTLGILGGVGYGMVYLPSIVCVCHYFDKRRALATGIAVSGTGIGVFIFGPLTNMLIDKYTWKGALLIEAALMLHCVPVGIVYVPLQQANSNRRKKKRKQLNHGASDSSSSDSKTCLNGVKDPSSESDRLLTSTESSDQDTYIFVDKSECFATLPSEIAKTEHSSLSDSLKSLVRTISRDYLGLFLIAPFAIFSLSNFLYDLFYLMPNFYLPVRAVLAGISEDKAAWLVSAIGISSTVSRVGFGWLFDKPCVNRMCLYATVLTFCGICTALGPQFSCFEVLLTYAIVYGLTSGLTISLGPVLLVDIIGIDKLAAGFGVCGMFGGVAELLGPPLAGWLYDKTGSYSISFLTAGASLAASGIILYSILCLRTNKHTPLNNEFDQ